MAIPRFFRLILCQDGTFYKSGLYLQRLEGQDSNNNIETILVIFFIKSFGYYHFRFLYHLSS